MQTRNEYLQNLYENAPFGCQSLDRNGCLVDVNGAWLDIPGFSRQEVIGQSFSEFLHPGQRDRFHEKFSGFRLTGEVVWDEQCRNLSGVSEGAGSTLKRR